MAEVTIDPPLAGISSIQADLGMIVARSAQRLRPGGRWPAHARWLVVAGTVHASFTDLALLADQIGIDIGADVTGARSLDITRAYVKAFFDQHLRSKPQALLDQPTPRYSEVTFCSPKTETRAAHTSESAAGVLPS